MDDAARVTEVKSRDNHHNDYLKKASPDIDHGQGNMESRVEREARLAYGEAERGMCNFFAPISSMRPNYGVGRFLGPPASLHRRDGLL